ncbi:Uncharacterised protein g11424 [Pycnogonum litorale]
MREWLAKLQRKDITPTIHSRLCSVHFTNNCFVTRRTDTRIERLEKSGPDLIKRRLTETAVPTIFPNCPPVMNMEVHQRPSNSSAGKRKETENQKLVTSITMMFESEWVKKR